MLPIAQVARIFFSGFHTLTMTPPLFTMHMECILRLK